MKKLLLFALALVACMSAMAGDWTLPVPKTVPLEYGQTIYFYNTEAQMFLTKGNSWDSQMSLGDTGLPVIVKAKTDTEYTDGGTYAMLWNDEAKAYFDQDKNGRQGWVNRAEDEALASELAVWKLQINADGTFQFGVPNQSKSCENPAFDDGDPSSNAKLWAGWNGYETSTEVIICLDTEIYESGYKWVAVAADEYAAFTATYSQRKALYNLIMQAEEVGVTIPSRIADVFNNADATADELIAARADLANVMLKHDLEVNGEADVTAQYIVNPNFDQDNYGWSNSVDGATVAANNWWLEKTWQTTGDTETNEVESVVMQGYLKIFCWSGSWVQNLPNSETTQTVTLPAGSYRLEADCVAFQEGDGSDSYGSPQDWTGRIKGFYIFAKNELGEARTAVATDGKTPKHFVVEFKAAGGETTFGMKVEDCVGSYFGGDNFRLYCTSLMGSPNLVELKSITDEMQKIVEAYTDAPFSMETLAQAEAFVNNAEQTINDEDEDASVALINDGKALIAKIAVEIAAYQRVREAYDEANSYIEAGEFELFGEDIVAQISENAIAMITHIELGDVTAEEALKLIDDYTSKLAHFIADDVNAIDEGLDATCLLQNGHFSRGTEWSNGGGSNMMPGWIGERPWTYNTDNGVVAGQIEYIGQDFDLYQELKGMPAGVYTITFRGLYRWGKKEDVVAAIGTADEDAKNVSRFYMNEFEAPIKSITADPFPLDEGEEAGGGNYSIGRNDADGNELFIPDATWYYMWRHQDHHYNSGAVLVGEGGTLRIGFRASGTDKDRWALISAPTLRYEGTSERALALLDPTAISAPVANAATSAVYTLNGLRLNAPQRGINIVVTKKADGTVETKKLFVK